MLLCCSRSGEEHRLRTGVLACYFDGLAGLA